MDEEALEKDLENARAGKNSNLHDAWLAIRVGGYALSNGFKKTKEMLHGADKKKISVLENKLNDLRSQKELLEKSATMQDEIKQLESEILKLRKTSGVDGK
jgi:hypothetical protein